MPPTEHDQYNEICKGEFTDIKSELRDIKKILVGNGQLGITGEIVRLKDRTEAQEARWKWIFGIVAVVFAGMMLSIIKSFL